MLGTDVLDALVAVGFQTVGLGREDADITDTRAVRDAMLEHEPDLVIHTAAMTAVDACEDFPDKAMAENSTGAMHVAAATLGLGIPVVHISTDYVFNGRATTPYPVDHPLDPLGMYGKGKAQGEIAVRLTNPAHYVVRTSWLCGMRGKNFVSTILRLSETNTTLKVVSDQVGAPTFTVDLASALVALVKNHFSEGVPAYGTYHITNSGQCSWFEFAKAILEQAGRENITVIPIDSNQLKSMMNYKAPRPAYSVLDTTLTEQIFGIHLPHWRDALKVFMSSLPKQ